MIKVGLVLSLRGLWQGGVNYYHNLLSCYQRYPDDALRLEVFTDQEEDIARYRLGGSGHWRARRRITRSDPGADSTRSRVGISYG